MFIISVQKAEVNKKISKLFIPINYLGFPPLTKGGWKNPLHLKIWSPETYLNLVAKHTGDENIHSCDFTNYLKEKGLHSTYNKLSSAKSQIKGLKRNPTQIFKIIITLIFIVLENTLKYCFRENRNDNNE